jgi:hypothetical protein
LTPEIDRPVKGTAAVVVAWICWAVLIASWWSTRRPRRLRGTELRRLQRVADNMHREQVLPFD